MKAEAKITQPSPSLLVVDDDPQLRFATVRILEQAGYTVLQGATAAEALTLTRAHRPALVLLDVMLPDGDGRAVARQLKSDPALTDVFVVLLSGLKISPEDQAVGLSEGLADGYLLRPVSGPVLLGWVESFLRLRATQETLRESEAKHRVIFNNEFYANCIFDLETLRFLEVNEVHTRLYGYSRAEFLAGMTTDDLTAESQASEVSIRQTAQEGAAFIPLRYHRKKDGTVFPVEIVGSPYLWQGRRVMFAVIRDLTDRLQAEAALRESEEKWRTLFAILPLGVSVLNRQGKLIDMNPTLETILNISREGLQTGLYRQREYLRSNSTPMPDDQFASVRAAREQRPVLNVETGVVKEDGEVVWTSVNAAPLPDGGVVLATVDITERKRGEEALRESEERFREVLENSLDASYKRNLHTNSYDYLSPVFAQLSGYTPDELKTLPLETVLELIHPADLAEIERVLDMSISGSPGIAYRMDYRFKHKDDGYRWFHDQFIVVQDASGQPAARIGSVSDITERKQAEAARAKLAAQKRQLEKAESLNLIAGAITEERLRISREIHDGVAQNLAWLRLKLGLWHDLIDEDPVRMHAELDKVQELLRQNIQEVRRAIFALRPIAIDELEFYPALHQFVADFGEQNQLQIDLDIVGPADKLPSPLEPVLFRLIQEGLNNVAKHARADTVSLRLNVQAARSVELTIHDDGLGFDPAGLPRAARQGHLGLTQMQERVAYLNGVIIITSEPGQGATLQISLPLPDYKEE
jgi:PAS domain S-box-containing protein